MAHALAVEPGPQPRFRLLFVDNLRVFLTILVILHHTGQAYGPTGGAWYYSHPGPRFPLLTAFFWVNASFFMGLFFFLSGYFLPGAYERKGAWPTVRDRLFRLGLPWLVFTMLLNSVQKYIQHLTIDHGALSFGSYFWKIYLGFGKQAGGWQVETGHLWFLLHLLIYALIYVGWRTLYRRPAPQGAPRLLIAPPGDLALLLYTVGLAAVTAGVRIWFPMDRWIVLFGFIPMEPAHFPQYLSLVVLGVMAWRNDWLRRLSPKVGYRWLGIGLVATLLPVPFFLGVPGAPGSKGLPPFIPLLMECLFCTSLCVGLLTLFREKLNRTGPLLEALGGAAFAAYLIHEHFVVPLQYAMDPVPWDAFPKFLVVGFSSVILTFAGALLLKRVAGLRSIL